MIIWDENTHRKKICVSIGIFRFLYSGADGRIIGRFAMRCALTHGMDEELSISDHRGHRFPSVARLCAFYDIDKAEFARRMDEGWTLKEALINPCEDKDI